MDLLKRKDIINETKATAIRKYVTGRLNKPGLSEDGETENPTVEKQKLLDIIATKAFMSYTMTYNELPEEFKELE